MSTIPTSTPSRNAWHADAYLADDDALAALAADLEWELDRVAADDEMSDDVRENTLAFLRHRLEPVEREQALRRRRNIQHPPLARGGYPRDVLDAIRQRLSLPNVLHNRGVELRRAGQTWRGCCPFHAGSNPSALAVWLDRFTCFGCGASGDVFTAMQALDGLNFRQAVEGLAAVADVELPPRVAVRVIERAVPA